MSYNFKKNKIINGLPFICFININASDATGGIIKSIANQIKLKVDDIEYVLDKDVPIFESADATINLDEILFSSKYKKSGDSSSTEYNQQPLNGKTLNEHFKIISSELNGYTFTNPKYEEGLKKIKTNNLGSNTLTILVESCYNLKSGSQLSDGVNTISIDGTKLDFHYINEIQDYNTLINNCIKHYFKEKIFGNSEGFLDSKKIEDIDYSRIFISKINDTQINGDLTNENISLIKETIKNQEILNITFSPYYYYKNITDVNITLSNDLKKIRKLKIDPNILNNFNSKIAKLTKKLDTETIKNFIKDAAGVTDDNIIEIAEVTDITDKKFDNIVITKDEGNKFSELMTGTIKFFFDNSKLTSLDKDEGSNKYQDKIDITFGTKCDDLNNLSVSTDTTKANIEDALKIYFGSIDNSGNSKYEIIYNSGIESNKVSGDFVITVNIKDEIDNFTKKKETDEQNVNVEFVIDNNEENKYKLVDGLNNTYVKTFKKDLNYDSFITALETHLGKTTGTLAGAIKGVKYNNGSSDIEWNSTNSNTIESLSIKKVTITLTKQEKGTFVEKIVSPLPENVTFTLNVSIPKGYNLRNNLTSQLQVTVVKTGLKCNVLKNEIKKTVTDGNFVIKKGNIVVNDNAIIGTETSDLTAYSIELTNNSSFIEEVTQPQPQQQNNNVTFTLNVSIPKGYKFRANSTNRVQIVVVKNGLTGKVLKDEIVKTFDDVKFTIKKGTTVISDGDTIGTETSDLNAYYVELLNDSKFIEKVEKQPKEGNEQGEETQVQQEKGKKPCSGKSANYKKK